MKPKVSIIVPVYNGEKTLSLCLDSLMDLDYPKEDLEIIVVDNGSTDETAKIIKQYPVKYVFEPHKGRARARNKGIKSTQGEFIAFLDADCIAHKDWIRNLLKGCNGSLVGGCGGEIHSYNPSTFWEKYAENRGFFHQERFIGKENLIPTLRTANVMYPKSVLENIGLFDEAFYNAEDQELSLKIALRGLKLSYTPDAIVYHKHRNSLRGLCKQFFEYGRYLRILKEKYKNTIALHYGPTFRSVFYPGRHSENLDNKEKPLDILYFAVNLIIYLAYSVGWLSLSLFKHPSIRPLDKPSSIPSKVFRKLDGELMISDIAEEYNYSLGIIGTRIYELLSQGATETEIIDELSGQYRLSKEEFRKDFTEFVTELKKEKLLN
ncbi:MAG: glycosyltransferase [Candidatus Omnitrophica bacterium]|nr:glycosyltransferase [Candidatus Omnitrophota bacterium]